MKVLHPDWEYVADGVMGGVSRGQAGPAQVAGRAAMRLSGAVSTDNGGGFIQMAFDLAEDVGGWTGLELDVYGNDERYDLRLRTTRLTRAWQSFRTEFVATTAWTTIKVPLMRSKPIGRTPVSMRPSCAVSAWSRWVVNSRLMWRSAACGCTRVLNLGLRRGRAPFEGIAIHVVARRFLHFQMQAGAGVGVCTGQVLVHLDPQTGRI